MSNQLQMGHSATRLAAPPVQGDTPLQKAVSIMLRRFLETEVLPDRDVDDAMGIVALHFAWWLLEHAEDLEETIVQLEA
jgi:hypothetical protein